MSTGNMSTGYIAADAMSMGNPSTKETFISLPSISRTSSFAVPITWSPAPTPPLTEASTAPSTEAPPAVEQIHRGEEFEASRLRLENYLAILHPEDRRQGAMQHYRATDDLEVCLNYILSHPDVDGPDPEQRMAERAATYERRAEAHLAYYGLEVEDLQADQFGDWSWEKGAMGPHRRHENVGPMGEIDPCAVPRVVANWKRFKVSWSAIFSGSSCRGVKSCAGKPEILNALKWIGKQAKRQRRAPKA